jgi:2-polyprenyl-3-methyl-5-hydroxy-6-metoxy-1,4-benzoquinol methylase
MNINITRRLINKTSYFFKWRKITSRLLRFLGYRRVKEIVENISPYIPVKAQVIDIGTGNGLVAEKISQKKDAKVTLIDVVDLNISRFPVKIFNGKLIPFEDKRFDIALLIDVIHHAEDEKALIKEAFRVAKKIIISEEVHRDRIKNFLTNIGDNIQIILYGMPLGIHSRDKKDWLDFLKNFSPKVKWVGDYKDPNPHALFVADSR